MVSPRRPAVLPLLLSAVLLAGLTACETFDPAGWVQGPVEPPERISTEGFDPDAPFPNLSQVPSAPPRPTPKRDRLDLARDLAVQRSKARYTTSVARPGATSRPVAQPAPSGTGRSSESASPLSRPAAPGPAPLLPIPAASEPAGPEALVRATPPAANQAGAVSRPVGQLVAVFYFPGSGSDLRPQDRSLIEAVASLHRQNGGRLRVVGHAAPRVRAAGPGSWGLARLRLSLTRASRVARTLAALGSAAEDLIVVAASDLDPGPFAGPGDARHHRVEIFLEQ